MVKSKAALLGLVALVSLGLSPARSQDASFGCKVLVLGDPRLLSKFYGRVFLDSLPPMPRTRDLARVQTFFVQ